MGPINRPPKTVWLNINDQVIYHGIAGEILAVAQVKGITRTAKPLLDLEFLNGEHANRIPLSAISLANSTTQVPA